MLRFSLSLLLTTILFTCVQSQVKQFYWKQDVNGNAIPFVSGKYIDLMQAGNYPMLQFLDDRYTLDYVFHVATDGRTMDTTRIMTIDTKTQMVGGRKIFVGLMVSPSLGFPSGRQIKTLDVGTYLTDTITVKMAKYSGTMTLDSDTMRYLYSRNQIDSLFDNMNTYQTFTAFTYSALPGDNYYGAFANPGYNNNLLSLDRQQFIVVRPFVLSILSVYINSQTGNPTSTLITVNKNGSASALTVTAASTGYTAANGTGRQFSDTTHTVSFAVGDLVSLYVHGISGTSTNIVISALAKYTGHQ